MYLKPEKILTISLKQESQILYIFNHRVWYHIWVTIKSKVMTCYKTVNYHVPVIRKSDIIEPEIIDTDYITCYHSQFEWLWNKRNQKNCYKTNMTLFGWFCLWFFAYFSNNLMPIFDNFPLSITFISILFLFLEVWDSNEIKWCFFYCVSSHIIIIDLFGVFF